MELGEHEGRSCSCGPRTVKRTGSKRSSEICTSPGSTNKTFHCFSCVSSREEMVFPLGNLVSVAMAPHRLAKKDRCPYRQRLDWGFQTFKPKCLCPGLSRIFSQSIRFPLVGGSKDQVRAMSSKSLTGGSSVRRCRSRSLARRKVAALRQLLHRLRPGYAGRCTQEQWLSSYPRKSGNIAGDPTKHL
ncbi:hypothetical protein SAMN05216525_13235 [Bradyrhizobium sp. Gha]|nr:hypothetical protein SAMN05216525_13235 [Bradyrhizobium sp. Gha]